MLFLLLIIFTCNASFLFAMQAPAPSENVFSVVKEEYLQTLPENPPQIVPPANQTIQQMIESELNEQLNLLPRKKFTRAIELIEQANYLAHKPILPKDARNDLNILVGSNATPTRCL